MKEIKYGDSRDILITEYGLELLEYFRSELLKYAGWEMMGALIQPPHDLVSKKINEIKADILSAKSETEKYNISRERLETILTESKEQIKSMLDTEKILALMNKD